jgi:hypothetical protein
MQPTTADLWLSSSDGSPVEAALTVNATMDVPTLAASAGARLPYATGSVSESLHATATFSPVRGSVSVPTAVLHVDPVARSVYNGFGTFGVEPDDCDKGSASG